MTTPPAPDRALTDTAHLVVSCPDQPGIIATVSGLLRARGVNIIQSDQYSTDPEGGSFYLRMVLHVPDVGDRLPAIRDQLAAEVAEPFDMRFALRTRRPPSAWR